MVFKPKLKPIFFSVELGPRSKMVVMEFVPYTTLIVLNAVIVWKIAKSR